MGFIVDGCSILIGGLLGGLFRKKITIKTHTSLSIAIMFISMVGVLENILKTSDGKIIGEHTVVVTIALVAGYAIGDTLKLEDRIFSLSDSKSERKKGIVNSILFFAIGGLQISGPIVYALEGDSFQLILKGIIDFPFALMLGATYGIIVSLSSFVVVLIQLIIALCAYFLGNFVSEMLIRQLCSLGYLILFFSGFNMLCHPNYKIKNTNILPGILLIIIYNIITEVCSL